MRLSAMGDVAMTVPVLRALANQYPKLKLTVISRPFFKPFFKDIPNLHFFAFDEKARHKGILGLWRLYQDLKALNIDAFADLHNVLRSKVVRSLFALSGKKIAFVDKGRAEKKALTRAENELILTKQNLNLWSQDQYDELGRKVESYFLNDLPQHLVDIQIHRQVASAFNQSKWQRNPAISLGFGIDLD